jgi:thioredoxin 1
MNSVASLIEYRSLIENEPAILLYFSQDHCNVCKALKQKIETELRLAFPLLKLHHCDIQKHPELSAQNSVHVAPTIIIYFDGCETFRHSRHISIQQLIVQIDRPYQMLLS